MEVKYAMSKLGYRILWTAHNLRLVFEHLGIEPGQFGRIYE